MIKDNLILDWENLIYIPQNDNTNFIIKKAEDWNYCIDIILDIEKPVKMINFYILINSFLQNNIYYTYALAAVIIKPDNIKVMQKIRNQKITNMSISEFAEWIDYRISYDWKYVNEEDFYAFRLVLNKQIVEKYNLQHKKNILNYLKPIYPWKDEILNELRAEDFKEKAVHEQLVLQKQEITQLKNIILQLENELEKHKKKK
jgi:hypothetical protein